MGDLIPEQFWKNGLAWRVQHYYDLAMGGAIVNGSGTELLNLSMATEENLFSTPLENTVSIMIEYNDITSSTCSIVVGIKALDTIAEGTVLHVPVSQKRVQWNLFYESGTTPNGQTMMYDVVWALAGDTAGNQLPTMNPGDSTTITVPFETKALMIKEDLQVTAIVQDVASKKILGFRKNYSSPFGEIGIKTTGSAFSSHILNPLFLGNGTVRFTSPFTNGEFTLFSQTGRIITSINFLATANSGTVNLGKKVVPGAYIFQIKGHDGIALQGKLHITK